MIRNRVFAIWTVLLSIAAQATEIGFAPSASLLKCNPNFTIAPTDGTSLDVIQDSHGKWRFKSTAFVGEGTATCVTAKVSDDLNDINRIRRNLVIKSPDEKRAIIQELTKLLVENEDTE